MIRSRPGRREFLVIVACAFVVGAIGCGTDGTESTPEPTPVGAETGGSTPPSDPPTTATTPPDPAPSTTGTITPSTSTTPATTTSPATTEATTTVAEVEQTGWTVVDAGSVPSEAFPPCCGDTWHGDVSPPLEPAGQRLADGAYAVTMQWPVDPRQPLPLDVFRFEHCGLLPQSACEQPGLGDEFATDALGVDTSASRPLTVPLDGDVGAVVVGWDGTTNQQFVIEEATGTELAELAAEVDRAYAAVFADRFDSGEDADAIIADVLADPVGGFGPADASIGAVSFAPTSGPPLLFQAVFPYIDGQQTAGRGTDVLAVRSIQVADGRITVLVYSAYYP